MVGREHRFLEGVEEEQDAAVLSAFLVRYYVPAEARARRVVLPFPPADWDALRELLPETDWTVPQRGTAAPLAGAGRPQRPAPAGEPPHRVVRDRGAGRGSGLRPGPRPRAQRRCHGAWSASTSPTTRAGTPSARWSGSRPAAPRRASTANSRSRAWASRTISPPSTRWSPATSPAGATRQLPLPDLIVIDGGKGQLNAALEAARRSSGSAGIPIVSLAKREEEVFLPGRAESLRLSRRSPSLRLLQRARDEAHRFGLAYNRKRRTQRTITSELLNIPGVGPTTAPTLLERFGSLAGVKSASVSELATVPGFSTRLAERILDAPQQRS